MDGTKARACKLIDTYLNEMQNPQKIWKAVVLDCYETVDLAEGRHNGKVFKQKMIFKKKKQ